MIAMVTNAAGAMRLMCGLKIAQIGRRLLQR
jgi:hypothetical protein